MPANPSSVAALQALSQDLATSPGGSPGFEVASTQDAQRFSQAMASARDQFSQANQSHGPVAGVEGKSVGAQVIAGLSEMSSRLRADHKQISSLIEKASVSGDDQMMMKAIFSLGDYQQRVQIVSKVVSKAATSLDTLTRLQ